MSLVELLGARAAELESTPAYIFLTDGEVEHARLTFAELERRALAVAALLLDRWLVGELAL